MSLLHKCQTCGFGLLITVCGEKNHLIILGDTDCLTGIFLCIGFICIGKYDLVVIYKHFVDSECFLNITLIGFIFTGIADLYCAVFEDRKICGLLIAGHIVAIHDENAGRLACSHVVIRGIDTGHNRTVVVGVSRCGLLVKGCDLLSKFGHTVRGIVHILIGCEQFDCIDRHVNRCGKHFHLFTVFIVNSVNVLRYSVCKRGLLVRHKRKLGLRKIYATLCRGLQHQVICRIFICIVEAICRVFICIVEAICRVFICIVEAICRVFICIIEVVYRIAICAGSTIRLILLRRKLRCFWILLQRIIFSRHRSNGFRVLLVAIIRFCGKCGNRQEANEHHGA